MKRRREEACPICMHYHDYLGGEKCGVCGHQKVEAALPDRISDPLPHVVIEKFMYMGNYHNASSIHSLKFVGITHMLSLAPQQPELFQHTFQYHTVSSVPPDLEECFAFIDSVRTAGGRVLAYDMTCRNAAPYVVMGYLVREGQNLVSVIQHVSRMNPAIRLSEDCFQNLSNVEFARLGTRSVSWEQVNEAQKARQCPAIS